MPYLNWRVPSPDHSSFQIEPLSSGATPASGDRLRFRWALSMDRKHEFFAAIDELLKQTQGQVSGSSVPELRIDLPENWIFFLKMRESESRLLMAHPQQNEWVLTAALTESHLALIVERMRTSKSGDQVQWASLFKVSRLSNVEIHWEHL